MQSRMVRICEKVRQILLRHYAHKPARLHDAQRWLVETILTAEAHPALRQCADDEAIHAIRSNLQRLEEYLQSESDVPESLCAHYNYRMSEARAKRRYAISDQTWSYVHRLASESGINLQERTATIRYEKFQWHDRLEEALVNIDAVIDPRALDDMLVSTFEAYLSPRKRKRKGYEVYGVNLGMVRAVAEERRGRGMTMTRYVSVMRSQPELSAEASPGAVEPNERSLDVLLNAMLTLFPQYQAVGDFHSHLFANMNELIAEGGWRYSIDDQRTNVDIARRMTERGQSLQISFIIAIARSRRKTRMSRFRGMANTIQMTVGDCHVVVTGYRSLEGGRYSTKNIRLCLPGILE